MGDLCIFVVALHYYVDFACFCLESEHVSFFLPNSLHHLNPVNDQETAFQKSFVDLWSYFDLFLVDIENSALRLCISKVLVDDALL